MSKKIKSVYVCTACGNDSPKWQGKCPVCGEWNTYVEEKISTGAFSKNDSLASLLGDVKNKPLLLKEVETGDEPRIDMKDIELNRVLGGGLVPGSLVLLGGEPGIGKSTLLLQLYYT